MALGNHRILKSKGRLTLVETANPGMGIGYWVRSCSIGLWSGASLHEAEIQFELALKTTAAAAEIH